MKWIKNKIVRLLDWIDDRLLRHQWYWLCKFVSITLEDWWDMGHWNHRLVRRKYPNGAYMYEVHEVYYDEKDEVWGMTKDPCDVMGENKKVVKENLERMLRALEFPVLDYMEDTHDE